MTWYQQGASVDPDDWEPLARLYLTDGRLAAEVPTTARADAMLAQIGARLGSATTLLEMRRDSAGPRTPITDLPRRGIC